MTLSFLIHKQGFITDSNGNTRDILREREVIRDSETSRLGSLKCVRIIDANQVYDGLNLGRRIDVLWPDDEVMRQRGGRSYWKNWVPEDGMEGVVSGFLLLSFSRIYSFL